MAGVLFSCTEDDLSKPAHNHENLENHHVKKTKVGFQEMKNYIFKHTSSLFPASLTPSFSKDRDAYITAIDSTGITQISDGNVTSFTLHVNTLDDELYAYSNLVIKIYNGQTEEFIYHYNPTADWQSAFDMGEILPYEGEFYIADTSGETVDPALSSASGRMGGSGNCPISLWVPCYGPSCPCTNGEGMTYWLPAPCPTGGASQGGNPGYGGPLNPGGFPPTDPNPGGGGGSNNTDFDYFLMDLNNDQRGWLTANPVIMAQIYNYLGNNDYSDDAVNFAIEWLNELMNGNNEYSLNQVFIYFQNDYRSQMSDEELQIFDTLSPQSQFKYLRNAYYASRKAEDLYPASLYNGKGDAFRHAYFNAKNVISIGIYYAQALATAHENRPPNYQYEYKEVEMDLFNNQAGRTIGQIVESDPDYFNMLQMVINYLNNGNLRYLSNLLGGGSSGQATGQSNLIPTNQ